MRVEEIEPSLWKEKLAADWDRLLEQSADATVFLSFPWVDAWWRHFGAGRRPCLQAAWDQGGVLCGLAPLYSQPLRLWGIPGPRVLGILGDEGVGSEYLGILLKRGNEEAVILAMGDCLKEGWSVADLQGLREDNSAGRALLTALSAPAPRRIHVERHPCSKIELPGDYETYLASLPQKFRTTVRYRTNKLTKNFAVRLLRTEREEETGPHLDRLFAMHQDRWVAEGHPGSFTSDRKRAFYADVSREFLRRGWLRFYHLEVDGVIRASQFGFVYRGVLHSLQEAFDHEFHPPGVGGVGVVLRGTVLRECIAEGLREYDFLGGVEDFKTRWGTQTHYVSRVRIGAPGVSGAMAFAATAGVRRLKDWARERSPGWVVQGRERFRSWRRTRRARQVAQGTEGTQE